jgi:L-fucose isomerase-like protein
MRQPKIGFISCVHPLYDVAGVAAQRQAAIDGLREAGCAVIAPEIPRTSQDAVEAARYFRECDIDLALLFFCTWVAEDVTLALARELMDVPMLLWALPYLDKNIPMPSPITGLVASGSNIRRLGKRFTHQIGRVAPESVSQAVSAARVAGIARALRGARFGVFGYPCPGMIDVAVDEADLQKALGLTTVHLDLDALLRAAEAVAPEIVAPAAQRLVSAAARVEIGEQALADNLRLYAALKETIGAQKLDAYCVRCWPELRDQRKITPCAAHALLAEEGVPSTCEVDLPALVTTYLLSRMADAPAFTFDLTGYMEEEGAVQLAHCGAAAPALASPGGVQIRTHMRTGTGATFEFPFREGAVTMAKLLRPRNGKMRLFVAEGTVIASPEGVRGSAATVQPSPSAEAFMETVMREAVEHHIALVYGRWRRELKTFCEFTGIEYFE